MNFNKHLKGINRFLYSFYLRSRLFFPAQKSSTFSTLDQRGEGISRIYAINLDREKVRWLDLNKELDKVRDKSNKKLTGQLTRFSAINAREMSGVLNEEEVIPYYTLADQLYVDPQPRILPDKFDLERGGKPAVVAANLLNRQFNPETLNTWWSGDITYLRTAQGWLYLAIVMDLCSRKIVSWAFSDKPDSALTIRALRLAVNKRRPTGPVVFHSDQGAQYTSTKFQSCQQELGVTGSMSRKQLS